MAQVELCLLNIGLPDKAVTPQLDSFEEFDDHVSLAIIGVGQPVVIADKPSNRYET